MNSFRNILPSATSCLCAKETDRPSPAAAQSCSPHDPMDLMDQLIPMCAFMRGTHVNLKYVPAKNMGQSVDVPFRYPFQKLLGRGTFLYIDF